MQMSQMHYLPIAPVFFAILVGAFFIVLILRSVSYAYESLGVSHHAAMWLLFASLLGSFFNIPIAELPPEQVMSNQVVDFFGMRYEVPAVSNWQGTIIAVNVGGAVIPTLVSIYLLIKNQLWVKGLVATTIVAVIMHWLATPVPGVGIALPVFMPAVDHRDRRRNIVAARAARGGAARLYRRRAGHADRRRHHQSRQSARARRASRFHRRRRNF